MSWRMQSFETGRPTSGLPPLGKAGSSEDLLSPDALLNIGTGKPMPLGAHTLSNPTAVPQQCGSGLC